MFLKPVQPKNINSSENSDKHKETALGDMTIDFLNKYEDSLKNNQIETGLYKISVDEISSRVAGLYENIRKVVDWKEEHLMRRIAIERILKRRLFLRKNAEQAAEPLVIELIRGGHFPNNFIPRDRISQVKNLLFRYSFILNHSPESPRGETKSQFYDRIFKLAACELEELLDPLNYQQARILMEYMEEVMRYKIFIGQRAIDQYSISEKEKQIQIYVAVQQTLFKLDTPVISYNLLKRYYPKWFDSDLASVQLIARNFYRIFAQIEQKINHPLADKFYGVCELYNTPFILLGDILDQLGGQIKNKIAKPRLIKELIHGAYQKRLATLKRRLFRSGLYSVISVFFTNIISLYAIEIPFTRIVSGKINFLAGLFDIFFPTLLMMFLVMIIRMPRRDNFELVWQELSKILYRNNELGRVEAEIYPTKGIGMKLFCGFLYLLSFAICLGGIILMLHKLRFPLLSYFIFVIFTSLILFTGSIIRKRSRELYMRRSKEGFFAFITDPFILPLIYFGKWLSNKWQKYNLASIFFVILLDSPFAILIEFLEKWRYFLKEKKEGIH